MPTLFAWILSAVGPWAVKALVVIGFASVSFAGVTTAFDALSQYAQNSWASLPAAVLQLATACGVHQGIGLIFGAMSARIGLWSAANGTKLIFKGK